MTEPAKKTRFLVLSKEKPYKTMRFGTFLPQEVCNALDDFLRQSKYVFQGMFYLLPIKMSWLEPRNTHIYTTHKNDMVTQKELNQTIL